MGAEPSPYEPPPIFPDLEEKEKVSMLKRREMATAAASHLADWAMIRAEATARRHNAQETFELKKSEYERIVADLGAAAPPAATDTAVKAYLSTGAALLKNTPPANYPKALMKREPGQ